ncbi:MAG TPA: YdcF family protein [Chromobacteriaceae bacterium]|nr:YdcF family protein [Chromobacteriaceae bacterium]
MIVTPSPEVLIHQLFGALLLPPLNYLLLALCGIGLGRWYRRLGLSLLLMALLLGYLLSIPRTAMWLNGYLERYPVVDVTRLRDYQAIVVLGGGKKPAPEYGQNEPSADTLTRLRYAVRLSRLSGKPLLVTGGAPLGGEAEGLVMARMLAEDYGIKPRWVETRSNTTLQNASYSAALLRASGVRRIVLVSQGWHLARAVPFFREAGLQVLPAPTGWVRYEDGGLLWYVPSGRAMQECHAALRELVGQGFYALQGKGRH